MVANLDEYSEEARGGTTQFWSEVDDDYELCPLCGGEMHGESKHCITCASRLKARVVQEGVQLLIASDQREGGRQMVSAWWHATEVT